MSDSLKDRLLALLSSPSYMPMRKRGIAHALDIDDGDYREFKALLDELAEDGTIAELKKGKYGLPRVEDGAGHTPKATGINPWKPIPPQQEHTDDAPITEPGDEPGEGGDTPHSDAHSKLPAHWRTGRIDVKRAGMGYLISDPPGNDIFIPEENLGGALNGDLVAVELSRRVQSGSKKQGGFFRKPQLSKPTARVVKILERAKSEIVGTYFGHAQETSIRSGGRHRPIEPLHGSIVGHIVPDARGMFAELDVRFEDRGDAHDQDKVAVELVENESAHRSGRKPTARIVKIFGRAGDADADIAAILENHQIKLEFPDEVLAAAAAIPEEIPAEELAQRVLYEHPVTFTIDPDDAKDHDDAVALRTDESGNTVLLVHIADVSYYVREGSPIDVEARERATSVYLPGRVYPMLPQKLSNNMCSLKEGQLRLTKTVSITYGKNLTPLRIKIERSAIRSAAFLTYNQVKDALEKGDATLVRTDEIYQALLKMREFAAALREKRMAGGSLNLDLPETKLLLDSKNEVKGWIEAEHHWAHELIEDMMLAGNRAVAEYLVDSELPGLFRVHEEPDPAALKRFADFAREFGINIKPPFDRMKLKYAIERASTLEAAHAIHMALLTSLKQARYSAECHPHFALNFNRYLHFTSPIRRYPDLIVHRALDSRFKPGESALPEKPARRAGGKKENSAHFGRLEFMRTLADHCSRREREAAAAENDVIKFRQMQFLRRNLKEAHPGIITRVREFGLFVELQDCFVEGLVPIQSLGDDWYEYIEERHLLQGRKRGRSFQLGDKVEVRVGEIDLARKQVNLEIV